MKIFTNIISFNKKAFTLVEFAVALGISAFLVVIIYTMLLTAQQSFVQLYNASKSANNIRYFANSLRDSLSYASSNNGTVSNNPQLYERTNNGPFLTAIHRIGTTTKTDTYTATATVGSVSIIKDSTYSQNINNLRNVNAGSITGRFSLTRTNGTVSNVVLSNIRRIYYSEDSSGGSGFKRIFIGIIYDEVLNNGKADVIRTKRRIFCFTTKGY